MKRLSIVLAAALLILLAVWGLWRAGNEGAGGNAGGGVLSSIFSSEPAEYARLDKLRADWVRPVKNPQVDIERSATAGKQYNEELAKLSPELRARYLESRQGQMQQEQVEEMEEALDALAGMSEAQMTAMLDTLIDRMQEKMKDPEFMEQYKEALEQQAEIEKAQGQSFGADGKQNEETKKSIDDFSPRLRATGDEMQRRMIKRMQERGIPIPPGF